MKFESREDEKYYFQMLLFNVRGRIKGDLNRTNAYEEMGSLHNFIDSAGANLLHYSVEKDDVTTTQWLLDYGFDVDAQTKDKKTPIMLAVQSRREETVIRLLKAKARINLCDNDGETVFQKLSTDTIINSSIPGALLMKLLNKTETVEETTVKLFDVECPLNVALLMKNDQITESYLNRRQNDSKKDEVPAMHVAVHIEYLKGVQLLLEYGHDVNVKDSWGFSPIMRVRQVKCCQDEQLKILKLLLDRGSELTTIGESSPYRFMQLYSVFYYCAKEAISMVLEKNIDLSAKDRDGNTPLHYLACNSNPGVLELLQDQTFDINARTNYYGSTAIHFAALFGRVGALRFLLDNGGDVGAKDTCNRTPLEYAVMRDSRAIETTQTAVIKCVNLLLEFGAEIAISGKSTIFDSAFENDSEYLIQPILAHLAIMESIGTKIDSKISTKIDSDTRLARGFDVCKQELEEFKKSAIFEKVTMFELLTVNEQKLQIYLRNHDLVSNLERIDYLNNQTSCYYQKLQNRLDVALQKVEVKRRAAVGLCKIIGIDLHESHPMITDKICSYLTERDLSRLGQM